MTSRLKIAEYYGASFAGIQAPKGPALRIQAAIDFSDGQVHQSAAFGGDTRLIEISTTAPCAYRVGGENPTVTTDDQFMAAGGQRVYVVDPGDKLAVIADS